MASRVSQWSYANLVWHQAFQKTYEPIKPSVFQCNQLKLPQDSIFFSFCILPTAASMPQLSLKPTHSSVAGTLIAWEFEMPLPHRSSPSTNDEQLFSAPSGQKSNASMALTATRAFPPQAPLWFEALRQTDPVLSRDRKSVV